MLGGINRGRLLGKREECHLSYESQGSWVCTLKQMKISPVSFCCVEKAGVVHRPVINEANKSTSHVKSLFAGA